jgi:pyruvate dehydrogenase E2 component (dihydrolipoamide acetyltransferase)
MTRGAITLIRIPMWGLTMLDAELRAWLVREGDAVASGDPVAEIETDKIAGQVEAPCSGLVRRLVARPGEVLPVGAALGVIADAETPDADIETFLSAEGGPAGPEDAAR